jgi:UDP-N-acetylmuramate: L-alanyl-gamma-D-glutamyl-meso-diaminopimelate ligase
MGISGQKFDGAIQDFTGAARRLEAIETSEDATVYRDFAHAPSKLRATTAGVRASFPDRKLFACFELHTYSSLNRDFLPTYAGALNAADEAVVYFDPEVLAHKQLPALEEEYVRACFQRPDVKIVTSKEALEQIWATWQSGPRAVLLMSSGWFSGAKWPNQSQN